MSSDWLWKKFPAVSCFPLCVVKRKNEFYIPKRKNETRANFPPICHSAAPPFNLPYLLNIVTVKTHHILLVITLLRPAVNFKSKDTCLKKMIIYLLFTRRISLCYLWISSQWNRAEEHLNFFNMRYWNLIHHYWNLEKNEKSIIHKCQDEIASLTEYYF